MFSFRRDKVGFFVTLILLAIVAGTVVSTLVLLVVGVARGDWKEHLLSVQWVLGSAWVACIIIVLVRLKIYQVQHRHALRRQEADESQQTKSPTPPVEGGQTS